MTHKTDTVTAGSRQRNVAENRFPVDPAAGECEQPYVETNPGRADRPATVIEINLMEALDGASEEAQWVAVLAETVEISSDPELMADLKEALEDEDSDTPWRDAFPDQD